MPASVTYNLALVEVLGLAPALAIADAMCKAADVAIVGVEGNAGLECLIKCAGDAGNVQRALEAAREVAQRMHARFSSTLRLRFADSPAVPLIDTPQEYSGITEGYLHLLPRQQTDPGTRNPAMKAIGLLETQGLTAVIEGADAMLKAADVEIVGKEKIGAAHVTVLIRGDVAAVKTAIEAGRLAAEAVGKVVAAQVIPRPHEALAKLLPG